MDAAQYQATLISQVLQQHQALQQQALQQQQQQAPGSQDVCSIAADSVDLHLHAACQPFIVWLHLQSMC